MTQLAQLFSILFFLGTPIAFGAHDHSCHGHHCHEQSGKNLDQLRARLDSALQRGIEQSTWPEMEALGEGLIHLTLDELDHAFEQHQAEPLIHKAKDYLIDFSEHLNVVQMGRWLIQMGKIYGAPLAIALGVTELTETSMIFLSAKYPMLLPLIPLWLTHSLDAVMIAVGLGAITLFKNYQVWKNFGNSWTGAENYFQEILQRNRRFPPDWNVVLYIGETDQKFSVIQQSRWARILPRWVQVRISPEAQATSELFPTVFLWELQKIAQEAEINLRPLKPILSSDPRLFAVLLLHEIQESPKATEALQERLKQEQGKLPIEAAIKPLIPLPQMAKSSTLEELKQWVKDPKEIAGPLAWYFNFRLDQAKEVAEKSPREWKELSDLLHSFKGIDFNSWEVIWPRFKEIQTRLQKLEAGLHVHTHTNEHCSELLMPKKRL